VVVYLNVLINLVAVLVAVHAVVVLLVAVAEVVPVAVAEVAHVITAHALGVDLTIRTVIKGLVIVHEAHGGIVIRVINHVGVLIVVIAGTSALAITEILIV
jgi:hypothetical protein